MQRKDQYNHRDAEAQRKMERKIKKERLFYAGTHELQKENRRGGRIPICYLSLFMSS